MKQILHIFRKDLRQFWKEILVSLAFLALYAWHEPRTWVPERYVFDVMGMFISYGLLVIVSWLLLVVRVLQAEPLVGNRQFWITRPYRWPQLLAEKILFILFAVYLPLLVSSAYLLRKGGFAVGSGLADFMRVGLPYFVPLMILLMALASITRTLIQAGLTILAALLFIVGIGFVGQYHPVFSDIPHDLQGWLILAAAVAIILLQYARRRTRWSLTVLGILVVLVPLIMLAAPGEWLVKREYPVIQPASPTFLRMQLDPENEWKNRPGDSYRDDDKAHFVIPVRLSEDHRTHLFRVRAARVSVRTESGKEWQSPWRGRYEVVYPEDSRFSLSFDTDKKTWSGLVSSPARVRVSLLIEELQRTPVRVVSVSERENPIPELGRCRVQHNVSNLVCRYPVRIRRQLILQVHADDTQCTTNRYPGISHAWVGEEGSSLLTPVGVTTLYFPDWQGHVGADNQPRLCEGSRVEIVRPELVRRGQVAFEADAVRLKEYGRINPVLSIAP